MIWMGPCTDNNEYNKDDEKLKVVPNGMKGSKMKKKKDFEYKTINKNPSKYLRNFCLSKTSLLALNSPHFYL